MRTFALAAALVLSSTSALAEEAFVMSREDSSDKNICYIIGADYYKCARASRYCFWDTEDGRCEPLNDTSYCGRNHSKWSCESNSGCFWDYEDGRCETVN